MSLQWEVVGKSKKNQGKSKNVPGNDLNGETTTTKTPVVRKIDESGKKGNRKDNKENRKAPQESAKKPKSEAKVAANPEKGKKPVKKKFKNLEAALQELSVDDLKSHVEVFKANFKNSNIAWLKAILSYLNEALIVDVDAVFLCKPILYPASALPTTLKKLIHDELDAAGASNVQYFFDQCLTSLAVDLNKNLPVVGTRIMLQLIALRFPIVCQSNFAKNAVLHNSYLNQSSIGLSLLWALGQGGYQDCQVGINVWQNMMVPVIEMKHYCKYAVEYIFYILQKAPSNTSLKLTLQEYLNLMDTLMQTRNNIPHNIRNLLPESAFMISKLYIESTKNVSNIFLTLFKNLSTDSPNVYLFTLVQCLKTEPNCVKLWELNYKKLHQQHQILLNYIRDSKHGTSLKGNKPINDFLRTIDPNLVREEVNHVKNRHQGESKAKQQNTQEKTTSKRAEKSSKSSSICPWILGVFVLLGAIGGIIAYDVHVHGGQFEASSTGKFLKDTGALPYVETVWFTSLSYTARGYQWAEMNVPIFYGKARTALTPYCEFGCELATVVWNKVKQGFSSGCSFVQEKSPVVGNFVDQYIPGLSQRVGDATRATWGTISRLSVDYYHFGCEFFRTKVFVGSLSPENLSKALNETQVVAARYYSWFHDKVDAYAKIK
uniref:Uncharacterized protein n=1 Tax=Lutzomyia longipalpis TaxID=7200 RepID=A0A7G3AYD0_LUTLO